MADRILKIEDYFIKDTELLDVSQIKLAHEYRSAINSFQMVSEQTKFIEDLREDINWRIFEYRTFGIPMNAKFSKNTLKSKRVNENYLRYDTEYFYQLRNNIEKDTKEEEDEEENNKNTKVKIKNILSSKIVILSIIFFLIYWVGCDIYSRTLTMGHSPYEMWNGRYYAPGIGFADIATAAVNMSVETSVLSRTVCDPNYEQSYKRNGLRGQSCASFVSCCIIESGCDPEFSGSASVNGIIDHFNSAPDKWQFVGVLQNDGMKDMLQPGDILTSKDKNKNSYVGHSHVIVYTSNEVIRQRYPNVDRMDVCDASVPGGDGLVYGRYGALNPLSVKWYGPLAVWRFCGKVPEKQKEIENEENKERN